MMKEILNYRNLQLEVYVDLQILKFTQQLGSIFWTLPYDFFVK